jgi:putative transposase
MLSGAITTAEVSRAPKCSSGIVHLVRASLNYVPWKLRKSVAGDPQSIYRARTASEAEHRLQELEGKWKAYPSVSQVWRRELGADHAIFQLPAGHPPSDLHHQQRGIVEPVTAQDHQNPRRIPQRRGGAEVAVSRVADRRPRSGPCRFITGAKH